jgi:AraC-like DNA-binding protein
MDITALLPTINLISAFLLLLFSVFLVTRKNNNKLAFVFLALFLFSRVFILLDMAFNEWGLSNAVPHLSYVFFPFLFLYAPMLYLYTLKVTSAEFKFDLIKLLHIAPFLFYILWFSINFYFFSDQTKAILLRSADFNNHWFLNFKLLWIQFILYGSGCILLLIQYKKNLMQKMSYIDNNNLSWLWFLILAFLTWKAIFLAGYMFAIWKIPAYYTWFRIFVETGFLFYASAIVFKAMQHPDLFSGQVNGKKYKTSSLTETEKEQILSSLELIMQNEQLFLDPIFSLGQLSKKSGIQEHNISQVLNEKLNRNFYDYVNTYRIEQSKKMLADTTYNEMSIFQILLESGFNSKSVFNSAFRKYTGTTPSNFRKMSMNQLVRLN